MGYGLSILYRVYSFLNRFSRYSINQIKMKISINKMQDGYVLECSLGDLKEIIRESNPDSKIHRTIQEYCQE